MFIQLKENERGLTLVELLAIIIILSIVFLISFILIGNVISNSKKDAHISNAKQVLSAAKLLEANGTIHLNDNAEAKDVRDYDTIGSLIDPWNKEKYEIVEVGKKNKEYRVTLIPKSENVRSHCEIDDMSEEELQKERLEVCKP